MEGSLATNNLSSFPTEENPQQAQHGDVSRKRTGGTDQKAVPVVKKPRVDEVAQQLQPPELNNSNNPNNPNGPNDDFGQQQNLGQPSNAAFTALLVGLDLSLKLLITQLASIQEGNAQNQQIVMTRLSHLEFRLNEIHAQVNQGQLERKQHKALLDQQIISCTDANRHQINQSMTELKSELIALQQNNQVIAHGMNALLFQNDDSGDNANDANNSNQQGS